jgi:hypothetical protein
MFLVDGEHNQAEVVLQIQVLLKIVVHLKGHHHQQVHEHQTFQVVGEHNLEVLMVEVKEICHLLHLRILALLLLLLLFLEQLLLVEAGEHNKVVQDLELDKQIDLELDKIDMLLEVLVVGESKVE